MKFSGRVENTNFPKTERRVATVNRNGFDDNAIIRPVRADHSGGSGCPGSADGGEINDSHVRGFKCECELFSIIPIQSSHDYSFVPLFFSRHENR